MSDVVTDRELLDGAAERIERHRRGELSVQVLDAGGRPLPGARVRVEQVRHQFLFGTIVFRMPDPQDKAEPPQSSLLELFNYATLPFYWGNYEPSPGQLRRDELMKIARWCAEHGIATKGHPLVWFEVFPQWAKLLPDPLARQEERVRQIIADFAGRAGSHGQHQPGLIERWDVINEATVADRFKDDPLGRWFARDGAAEMVRRSLTWAREANPAATLLVNDYNVSPAYLAVLDAVVPLGLCDAIGIQSHMQAEPWTLGRAWNVCETYGRFGLPVHFTELTVVSGNLKPKDTDWYQNIPNWHSTPDGEARQAQYLADFYTLLFSHPAIEAITLWGLKDPLWLGSPGGLVRADGTRKPSFDALRRLIREQWWTSERGLTDGEGRFALCPFAGEHEVTIGLPGAMQIRQRITIPRRARCAMQVLLPRG